MGPMPQGKKQVKFLHVAIDYFTKFVEVEALPTITEAKVQNFMRRNIICRFAYQGWSYQTMVANSTARPSDLFVQGLESETNSRNLGTPKQMDRWK